MKSLALAFAAVLAVAVVKPASAADPVTINWGDLLPTERTYSDPFAEMGYRQIDDLAKLYRIETRKADKVDDAMRAEASEIRERLASQGLDPDWLFEQREIVMKQRVLAATEPNSDVLGKPVRLPGYLLPLEMVDQKAVEFLLVPTVGACIHTPPPPANQIVFVRYPQGFEVDGLYKPVWINGEMHAQNQYRSLHLVDGQANIETAYEVDATSVEAYK